MQIALNGLGGRSGLTVTPLAWQTIFMVTDPSFDDRRLSIAERSELVEDIWDSIGADADADALPLTDAEHALLDERLAESQANPGRG
ncbi:MAG: addiction module protein [Gemmatimonadaceae bacterium]|nr:addiction module protein [Gemmatimonadaceae bacterium]